VKQIANLSHPWLSRENMNYSLCSELLVLTKLSNTLIKA